MTDKASFPLLRADDVKTHFPVGGGQRVHAVDGVSFDVFDGETLGLVGESGCGKSTVGRSVLNLVEVTSGSVLFQGTDLTRLKRAEMRRMRKNMQMIFQDPYSSLDPRMSVGSLLAEAMTIHGLARSSRDAAEKGAHLLDQVGLSGDHLKRYPHEFSGGQRQRIGIARALAVKPKLIVCDEAVSALDVSVQAQIINLLQDLQAEHGLAYLFIAHDVSVVEHISRRIAVMYLGRIMELAPARQLCTKPSHPYTQALLSAVPTPNPARKNTTRILLKGDVPSAINPPSGCRFHTRCPMRVPSCAVNEQKLVELSPGHWVACQERTGVVAAEPATVAA
ncbi:ABC transporter ATP-binding protein [Aquibium oceanicum]|uniref:ABC transporter ATP-binding protein n=1 Tax=Aquibium oceanicum TaxID=1670800 RepID=UPI0036072C06